VISKGSYLSKARIRETPGAVLFILLALLSTALDADGDSTFVFAVQLSAIVQETPPQVVLSWPQDPYGAKAYTVYRKQRNDLSWGTPVAILPGSVTTFSDSNVTVGSAWEYQVVKDATLGYKGYGYIYAGIRAPLIEQRGTLILVVEQSASASLPVELKRLQSDLVGDGWQVIAHSVSSNATPEAVRSLIASDYYADPANVKALFLFGHVPILQSGRLDYDGHLVRPMPADAYYGDMDTAWLTDPASSPSFLPSDVELMVGRVDLANMPGQGSAIPWPPEIELLRNYLNKDHRWRNKEFTVPRRALMGNLRGDEGGSACAASGYRNFEPFVGPGNTFESNVSYSAPIDQLWISRLGSGSYLWAYACGAGLPNGVSGMGTNVYNFAFGIDLTAVDARAVFYMMFGSWFGDWDSTDNLIRAVLATPTAGLAACMAGRPHWYLHHMALGEPIGYGTRLSMNNSTLYQNQTNVMARAVYVALMGDPTLRLDQAMPPGWVSAAQAGSQVTVTWGASTDASAGYHVYRSASPTGPFTRITATPQTGTELTDISPPLGQVTYMVRGINLEQHFSGSYYNPSQGAFGSVVVQPPTEITVATTRVPQGLQLSWNSLAGTTYRVLATTNLTGGAWTDLSGTLTANSDATSWIDASALNLQRRFYRVASP